MSTLTFNLCKVFTLSCIHDNICNLGYFLKEKYLRYLFIQVFDCWDPAQFEDVAQNCIDWVRRLTSDKSVRIILVATPCYRLLEASLITDIRVQYREPSAFDSVFVFALRHLIQTTIMDSYNRIFVVRQLIYKLICFNITRQHLARKNVIQTL